MNSRDGSMDQQQQQQQQQKEQQRISVPTATRRQHLMTVSSTLSLLFTMSLPSHAIADDPRRTIVVRLESSLDSLGVQVFNTQLRGKPVVAIQRIIRPKDSRLQPGMIVEGYNSAEQLLQTIQNGPYPLELKFINLAAGGDAFSDMGTTLVTPKDALELAQRTEGNNNPSLSSTKRGLSITTLRRPMSSDCAIESRRGDVLEIIYEASYIGRDGKKVVYDASEFRGTGQPYQLVLGNGDMIPGVDQGLYGMCPGEERLLDIPPVLGYSSQGTRIFRIPPDYQSLEWTVHLVSIDTTIREDNNILSRPEREGRAL
ncbi:FKBP-type peptidyl-prolyl cis-trans isomerase [Nitzschia inconspicua]|uniref:peptidylprolyl isomerase n=1 Tax=Nitzschia inconspicua TaxID=303405 RepID=A0A9K3LPQ6_9STRA|nr:FKBP-type peptidyl-prolyl cis-trans isomerase [Nitzschia inconspicua]